MWCISSGYSCSKEICKTWGDYIDDLNECRSKGATDRLTTGYLSILSFIGLSNFYMGNIFAGCCELANGIMALISVITICICYDSYEGYDNKASCVARKFGMWIAILNLAKAIHMVATGSVEATEVAVMIISTIIVCMHCAENETHRPHGITITLLITIVTGVLETIRDVYAVKYYDRDGYGCPFV